MKCPTCPDDTLVMTERSGVEIDYCPSCRGVWLDRGELDKIIERSAAPLGPSGRGADRLPVDRPAVDRRGDDRERNDRYDRYDLDDIDDDDVRSGRRPKRRRESLLSELFDF